MSKEITVCLPWNDSFGGGSQYELVPFIPGPSYPEQQGCFLLRPARISIEPNLNKMTKAQLIEYIAENYPPNKETI